MYRRLTIISGQLEELGLTHERNINVLLRRLARTHEIEPLQTSLGVIEPVKQYNRGKQHPTTMLSPLSSLVDAARPDSAASRRFAQLTNGLLDDAPRFQANLEALHAVLTEGRALHPQITRLAARSPQLQSADSLAASLTEIADIGLEGLNYLTAGKVPAKDWCAATLRKLNAAAQPRDALEFSIIESVRKLVIAAAELAELQSSTPAEWKKRINALTAESAAEKR